MSKRIFFCFVVVFTVIVLGAGFGFAQQGSQAKGKEQPPERITVTGRIDYSEKLGGYYIEAANPPTRIFIVNPDKKTLDRIRQSKRPVKIEGVLTIGADHLKVEKIDGRPYPPSAGGRTNR